MALIGYARVSTEQQTMRSQVDVLVAVGCERIVEEHGSGGNARRPRLAVLLAELQAGDTLVVARIDRLARSLSHLLQGIHFRSLADPIDTASPQGRFTLQVMGAVAEFERALIRERVMAGLAAARARGRIGGNPALRARDPLACAAVAAARRASTLTALLATAERWLPVVERMRPGASWRAVAGALNADGGGWSEARLVHAVRRLVEIGRADAALLAPAPRTKPRDPQLNVVAGILRASPSMSLRDVGAELRHLGMTTPRGNARWHPSSVALLVERVRRAGLLRERAT